MKPHGPTLLGHTRRLLDRDQRDRIRRYLGDPREQTRAGWRGIHALPVASTDGVLTPLWLALMRTDVRLQVCGPGWFGIPGERLPTAVELVRALRWARAQPVSTQQAPGYA